MTLLPQLLTEAAHGGLKPSPTGRLRRVLLHLSYSMALSHLLDTTPPSLFTTAACGGLRPAPDYRSRRALLHLSYSSAPAYSDGASVTHAPQPTSAIIPPWGTWEWWTCRLAHRQPQAARNRSQCCRFRYGSGRSITTSGMIVRKRDHRMRSSPKA